MIETLDLDQPDALADDDDDDPPPGPPVARLGDLWRLGDHRLYCGSALEPRSYQRLLGPSEKVLAWFTDPPWNLQVDGFVSGKGKRRHREFVEGSGEMDEPAFDQFLETGRGLAAQHSRSGAVMFVCIDWRHFASVVAAGQACGLTLINLCVWTKPVGGMGSLYRSAHELVPVFRLGKAAHRNNVQLGVHGRNRTNCWAYPGANQFLRASKDADLVGGHPTPKPVRMVADALLDVTARRDLVLDPFMGSGATLLAAERTGRRCRGMDLDPLYVDLTIRRWRRLTGEEAVLESTGESFGALEITGEAGR